MYAYKEMKIAKRNNNKKKKNNNKFVRYPPAPQCVCVCVKQAVERSERRLGFLFLWQLLLLFLAQCGRWRVGVAWWFGVCSMHG